MSCLVCPAPVAAEQLSQNAIEAVPECAALCESHLRILIQRRIDEERRAAWDATRSWCLACGREILYRPEGRTLCINCLKPTTVVAAPAGTAVSLRIPEDHYRSRSCDEPDCSAKMVFHYPATGRTMCDKHGAAPEPLDSHL